MTDIALKPLILAADVGRLLGCSAQYVRDHYKDWVKEAGFPAPLPLFARAKWDEGAIEIWLQRRRPAELRTIALPAPPAANRDDAPEDTAAARLAGLAPAGRAQERV